MACKRGSLVLATLKNAIGPLLVKFSMPRSLPHRVLLAFLQLLAHPVTQPWISDGDQLSLSYLESIAVHKAFSGAVKGSAISSYSKEGLPGDEVRGNRESGAPGESKSTEKGGGGGVEELDDDDDVGFRVTFVSTWRRFFCLRCVFWQPVIPSRQKFDA